MVIWVYGCMDVWVYGCMVVWVYGCMIIWMYGCMGVCVVAGSIYSEVELIVFLTNMKCTNPLVSGQSVSGSGYSDSDLGT